MKIEDFYQPAQKETLGLAEKLMTNLPYFVSALMVLLVAYFIGRFLSTRAKKLIFHQNSNELVSTAISKGLFFLIIILGVYISLNTLGLTRLAFTLAGGTGLIGIGLGLALKGTFENYLSGMVISLKDIFRKGEVVAIGEFEGIVQNVTTRGTTLMDYDGNSIIIPNAHVVSSAIKNFTRNPKMRLSFEVGVGYEDDLQKVKNLIIHFLSEHTDKILLDPPPMVNVMNLGSATVVVRVYFWINSHQVSRFKVRSWAIHSIKNLLMENKVSLPDDAREIIFASPLKIEQAEQKNSVGPQPKNQSNGQSSPHFLDEDEEVSSDLDELRSQAFSTEAPEGGSSLI